MQQRSFLDALGFPWYISILACRYAALKSSWISLQMRGGDKFLFMDSLRGSFECFYDFLKDLKIYLKGSGLKSKGFDGFVLFEIFLFDFFVFIISLLLGFQSFSTVYELMIFL